MRKESNFNLGHDAGAGVAPATSLEALALGGYLRPSPHLSTLWHLSRPALPVSSLSVPSSRHLCRPSVSTHYLLNASRLPLPASALGHFAGERRRSSVALLDRAATLEVSSLLADRQKQLLLRSTINVVIFSPQVQSFLLQPNSLTWPVIF